MTRRHLYRRCISTWIYQFEAFRYLTRVSDDDITTSKTDEGRIDACAILMTPLSDPESPRLGGWRRLSAPPLRLITTLASPPTIHPHNLTNLLHMRFPSFPNFLRAINTVTNTTSAFLRSNPASTLGRTIYNTPQRAVVYRSMPNIPFLGALFGSSASNMSDNSDYPVKKPEGEWQAQLSPEQFRILRQKGTEMPGSGKYNKHYPTAGIYNCGACDAPLYKANHKFDSGCGWPAFWDAIPGAVGQKPDPGLGMMRTEIVCNNCGGHLGHIFKGERFGNPKDERHCVNSVSINFSAKEGEGEGKL
ncbi:hypothetical protein HRS9122_09099 [Pyrenophora teres f. teres]|nr:hypothetical protein HRS9122_09099 [Pyrenophora teres f. teres]